MDPFAVFVGVGLGAVIAGSIHFGWQQAMAFCRKLERHGVSLRDWYEDRGDPVVGQEPAQKIHLAR